MKYLVNRETKEHRKYNGSMADQQLVGMMPDVWSIVEADADGWIKWGGGECPLPDDAHVFVRTSYGKETSHPARMVWWKSPSSVVTHYRPILDKPEADTSLYCPDFDMTAPAPDCGPEQQCNDLLARLKSAHEAAQSIPDLLAELREALGAMGYDVVARSPFVEQRQDIPPDRWAAGYFVECVDDRDVKNSVTVGKIYEVLVSPTPHSNMIAIKSDRGIVEGLRAGRFRFHSRP